MKTRIHQEATYKSSPAQIFMALLNDEQFSKVTGGAPTEITPEAGGKFSCFGGMITGRNIELVANERIVQAWRAGTWAPGVYSIVKFELKSNGDGTTLSLEHSGFPEDQAEHLSAGWAQNYFDNLRKFLN